MKGSIRFILALVAGLTAAESRAVDIQVEPYGAVAGGLKGELPILRPGLIREPRLTTLAVSRVGVHANLGDWIQIESEFEADAGIHGTSVWEGQAALEVRNQLIRLKPGHWLVEVGRVTDEASVDFFSAHIADMLLTDSATRDPFLYSGYNRGNGVRGTYELIPGLRVGLTLNAANPVSTTGSLVVGGTYPPFDRFYLVPYQAVNQVANHYPDDTFLIYILTPSVLYKSGIVEAKAAVQLYSADTDTTRFDNALITGFNARGAVQLNLMDGKIVPFGNISFNRNDMLDPNNVLKKQEAKYESLTFGGGVDYNYSGKNGIGAEFMRVQYHLGPSYITSLNYFNLGTTYWIHPAVALCARASVSVHHEARANSNDDGERALFTTVRAVF